MHAQYAMNHVARISPDVATGSGSYRRRADPGRFSVVGGREAGQEAAGRTRSSHRRGRGGWPARRRGGGRGRRRRPGRPPPPVRGARPGPGGCPGRRPRHGCR
ncbi:hypothetical protein F7Q99_34035 [Streptomyces kaniharaensis]|uniref:Uncharacterized protein n=1 Tax=Streptomyces kaniharaensis TaxID=212423 RepID=A0A6N7KZF7_9ACTN|nr:hypothetical protein [Streptomyces kaniharaensis]